MIANISPASSSYFETNSTLNFAKNTKQIKNKPLINENNEDNVKKLRIEIKQLKARIVQLESDKASAYVSSLNSKEQQYLSPMSASNPKRLTNYNQKRFSDIDMQIDGEHKNLSPSCLSDLSELNAEASKVNAYLLQRIEKCEKLLVLLKEKGIKTNQYYEAEISQRNDSNQQLEESIEKYKKIHMLDQQTISEKDALISTLTNNLVPDIVKDQYIKSLQSEVEGLQIKIRSDVELQTLKNEHEKVVKDLRLIRGDAVISSSVSTF